MLLYYLSSVLFLMLSVLFFNLSMIFLMHNLNYFLEWNVLILNSFMMNMYLYLDWMSLMFMFVVLLISSMILIYSSEYMLHDLSINRFFYLLFFFIISMLLVILSPNMVSILLGWDGLGLVSYCLVIYYQNFYSFNSGMLTILMNRIGDVFILMSLGIMMMFGSWNFLLMNKYNFINLILIILASFTKSAQFPFSSWLPAAMAAPTPISSLVHSSTLVTAGVYLMIRFHYLIFNNEILLNYILIIGLMTMFMSGLSANFEYDLKKIIAYSTLSQLGLMMMIIGMMNYELSFFHLIVHAMFKSMMFMCSGLMIHSYLNYQDIRYMGLMVKFMPFTSMIFMISNLSLCGMPFFSGFYSKDLILEYMMMNNMNFMTYLFMLISTGLTISYSMRLSLYLMNNNFNFFPMNNLKDLKLMNYSMLILLLLTIFMGYIMNWIMFFMIEEIYLMIFEKIIIYLIMFFFLFFGFMIFQINKNWKFMYFYKIFLGKLWFLYNMNFMINKLFLIFGFNVMKLNDKGYMEYMFKNLILDYSKNLNKINLNLNYLLILLLLISYFLMLLFIF